jgi:signal transduction histidine kinase
LGMNYQVRGVFDSALFYFQQVLAYDIEQADSLSIGSSYNNVGVVQLGLKNYTKAEEFFLLSLEYKRSQNDSQGYANTCNNLAETYLQTKPLNVLIWLNQAREIAEKKGFKSVLAESYRIYVDYYKLSSNYKLALEYKEKYHALNDSLRSDELNVKLEQIQKQYEIEHLAKENAEQNIAIAKQTHAEKLYYLAFIALLVLGGFMVLAIYKSRQLNKKLQLQQRQIINQNRILHANNVELILAKEAAEEATQAKSQFLSTMSHEIRTPLNAIIGLANLLKDNNPRPDQKENIDVLKISSNNLLAILNDVLDFSKLEAGKMEVEMVDFNLKTLVNHLYELFSVKTNEKGLKLTLDFDYKIPARLKGDSLHINQVLSNLISNAIKFTQEGSVQIAVVLNSKNSEQHHITFSVADTGIGIPFEKQQAIFESFTQADSNTTRVFGGTGLGLSISTKLLGMMGSKLLLKSEPGVGSVFSFELDLEQSAQQKSEVPEILLPEDQDNKLWGRKILLAEDNQINLFVVKQFLSKWGVSIAIAENGLQAVDMALSQHYDLILMDLHMPMMDGYLATQRILEDKPKQVILAMTANQDREVERRTKEVGIKGVILKPFQPEQLAKQLEDALTLNAFVGSEKAF